MCHRGPNGGHPWLGVRKTGDTTRPGKGENESVTSLLRAALAPIALAIAIALFACGRAEAAGGNYVFQGGTPAQQSQVRQALNASSFDWNLVPGQITIVISPTPTSEAVPGKVFLDPRLLDSGEFAWGVVQHEYAHQVDFALLNDATRARLNSALGGNVWCYADSATQLMHEQYGCERFASTLAWAYWQSPSNCMKPSAVAGESAGMSPAAFRALLTSVLGAGPEVQAPSSTAKAFAPPTTITRKSVSTKHSAR